MSCLSEINTYFFPESLRILLGNFGEIIKKRKGHVSVLSTIFPMYLLVVLMPKENLWNRWHLIIYWTTSSVCGQTAKTKTPKTQTTPNPKNPGKQKCITVGTSIGHDRTGWQMFRCHSKVAMKKGNVMWGVISKYFLVDKNINGIAGRSDKSSPELLLKCQVAKVQIRRKLTLCVCAKVNLGRPF